MGRMPTGDPLTIGRNPKPPARALTAEGRIRWRSTEGRHCIVVASVHTIRTAFLPGGNPAMPLNFDEQILNVVRAHARDIRCLGEDWGRRDVSFWRAS